MFPLDLFATAVGPHSWILVDSFEMVKSWRICFMCGCSDLEEFKCESSTMLLQQVIVLGAVQRGQQVAL